MLSPEYLGGRPIEDLFLYETNNQALSIDDFIKINNNKEGCKLICYFYGGSMTINNFINKYKDQCFRLDLVGH